MSAGAVHIAVPFGGAMQCSVDTLQREPGGASNLHREMALFHWELDRLDRVRPIKRKMHRFVRLHQSDKYVELVAFRRAALRVDQAFDFP